MRIETSITLSGKEKEIILNDCSPLNEIDHIKVWQDNDELVYQPFYTRKIKRIRRITGYFSEINNFNNAKKAELKDRVTHGA